jgi:hypothetical protein
MVGVFKKLYFEGIMGIRVTIGFRVHTEIKFRVIWASEINMGSYGTSCPGCIKA